MNALSDAASDDRSSSAPTARAAGVPLNVIFGLLMAVLLDTAVQICWKLAVRGIAPNLPFYDVLLSTLARPAFYGVLALFAFQFTNWMVVLSRTDLSYAQPITALSYVTVCAASTWMFGEHLPPQRLAGVALVLIGVWIVTGSGHRTANAPSPVHSAQPLTIGDPAPPDAAREART